MDLLSEAKNILKEEGSKELLKRSNAFILAQALAILDNSIILYDNEDIAAAAEELVQIQDPKQISFTLSNIYPESAGTPDYMNAQTLSDRNKDVTTNLGRTVYEFKNGLIHGAAPGIGLKTTRYKPPTSGSPATLQIGSRFIIPEALGTKTKRKERTIHMLSKRLGWKNIIIKQPQRTNPDREYDSLFLLPNPYGQAFGKWISDLFKIRAYEQYCTLAGENPKLMLTVDRTDLVEETMELLGYPRNSYLTLNHETVRGERLLVPSHRPRKAVGEYQPSPEDRRWLRDKMLSNIDGHTNSNKKRLYISRQDESRRKISNFNDIKPILDEYDIEIYNPGNHSIINQIQTFAEAELVVGPHGSGLTNSMFTSDGSIIEFISTKHNRVSSIPVLANELDLDYHLILCEPIPESHSSTRSQDLIIDSDLLRSSIKNALNDNDDPVA